MALYPSIMLRAPLTLAAICLVAATALATLERTTRDQIAAVRAQSQLAAFTTLLTRQNKPSSDENVQKLALKVIETQKAVSDSEVVQAIFSIPENAQAGLNAAIPKLYILRLAGRGFGGPLEIFAAYRSNGSLYHAIMLDNAETPGFGKKAENPAYMQMLWDYGSQKTALDAGNASQNTDKASDPIQAIPTTKQALEKAEPNTSTQNTNQNSNKLDAVTGSTISFSAISNALLAGADWLVAQKDL